MGKAEKLTRAALAAFMAAALIVGGSACSSGETKQGGADSSTKAAVNTESTESTGETSASQSTEAPASDTATQERIDPATIDVSNIDVTIPFGSGAKIVDFTNDMQAGKYDYKVVKCEGITSRRMTGNAMMQKQDDGTSRGFTWILLDTMDPDAYPPEDAQVEITGVVGIGDYGVRYVYVQPENVIIKTGAAAEDTNDSAKALIKTGVWWATGAPDGDESFYIFREDGTGSVIFQSMGIGTPYNYKFGDGECTFEMGAAGNFSTAKITVVNENECTFDWTELGMKETLIYYGKENGFSFYSNQDLITMAKGWLADKKGIIPGDGDAQIQPDKSIRVHFEYLGEDKTPGDYWFDIDRFTGKGKDMNGADVDLTPYNAEDMNGTGYVPGNPGDPFYRQLDALKNEGAPIGVRYLGYIQPDANDLAVNSSYIDHILSVTKTIDFCDLRNNGADLKLVTTGDGTEFYLIIPADPKMKIEVFKAVLDEDTAKLTKSGSVYSGDGTPFLLKCNVSEVIPDVVIAVTDENGKSFEWSPSISGMDGTVVIKNAAGRNIKDFTDYKSLATTNDTPNG